MDSMALFYVSTLIISCAVLVYSYFDGKRSDENLEAFFEEVLKDELAGARKEIQRLRTELCKIKSHSLKPDH